MLKAVRVEVDLDPARLVPVDADGSRRQGVQHPGAAGDGPDGYRVLALQLVSGLRAQIGP